MVFVCSEPDLFTAQAFERGTVWVAELSNGQTIYQDDERDGVEPESAWERLGIYCKENSFYVVDMYVQNGTNVVQVGKDYDGYYFCKGAGGFLHGDGRTYHTYIVGTLENGLMQVAHYNVPEMTVGFTETRDPDSAGVCLITKPGVLSDEKKK
jgi:hypothetical protein|tara:strand:+ start:451 stop:909 length:459 start_codon:yes stop_codon:yes gene_type:complete